MTDIERKRSVIGSDQKLNIPEQNSTIEWGRIPYLLKINGLIDN